MQNKHSDTLRCTHSSSEKIYKQCADPHSVNEQLVRATPSLSGKSPLVGRCHTVVQECKAIQTHTHTQGVDGVTCSQDGWDALSCECACAKGCKKCDEKSCLLKALTLHAQLSTQDALQLLHMILRGRAGRSKAHPLLLQNRSRLQDHVSRGAGQAGCWNANHFEVSVHVWLEAGSQLSLPALHLGQWVYPQLCQPFGLPLLCLCDVDA